MEIHASKNSNPGIDTQKIPTNVKNQNFSAEKVSELANKPTDQTLPTVPDTLTSAKIGIGAAALILGTGVCIGFTKADNNSLWGRFATKVKNVIKSAKQFAENHPTIIKIGIAAVTVGIGAAVLQKTASDPDSDPITPGQENLRRKHLLLTKYSEDSPVDKVYMEIDMLTWKARRSSPEIQALFEKLYEVEKPRLEREIERDRLRDPKDIAAELEWLKRMSKQTRD